MEAVDHRSVHEDHARGTQGLGEHDRHQDAPERVIDGSEAWHCHQGARQKAWNRWACVSKSRGKICASS